MRVREAQIPVVNDNECVRKINAVTEKIFILPASSFCAGGEEGHDACQVINKKMHLEKKYVNLYSQVINQEIYLEKNLSISHGFLDTLFYLLYI